MGEESGKRFSNTSLYRESRKRGLVVGGCVREVGWGRKEGGGGETSSLVDTVEHFFRLTSTHDFVDQTTCFHLHLIGSLESYVVDVIYIGTTKDTLYESVMTGGRVSEREIFICNHSSAPPNDPFQDLPFISQIGSAHSYPQDIHFLP